MATQARPVASWKQMQCHLCFFFSFFFEIRKQENKKMIEIYKKERSICTCIGSTPSRKRIPASFSRAAKPNPSVKALARLLYGVYTYGVCAIVTKSIRCSLSCKRVIKLRFACLTKNAGVLLTAVSQLCPLDTARWFVCVPIDLLRIRLWRPFSGPPDQCTWIFPYSWIQEWSGRVFW